MILKEPIKLTSICQKFEAPVRSIHLDEQEITGMQDTDRIGYNPTKVQNRQ
jgi:hypothetical protein